MGLAVAEAVVISPEAAAAIAARAAAAASSGGSGGSSVSAAAAASSSLSEVWSVEAKHEGCYTGGKVEWSEAAGVLACLYEEELHLVDHVGAEPTRRIVQEADAVLTFAVDPAGQNACTSHRSGLLRHFRLGEQPSMVRAWKAHEQVVADVCFDATGSFVATGSVDRSAKVFDFTGYFCTHSFRGHPGLVSIVRFHPGRLQLVTVSDTEVRLWDLQTSQCVGVMKDHLTSISSICFGKVKAGLFQLVSAGRDQVVNLWHLEDKCSLARSIPVFEKVEGVATVPTQGLLHVSSEKAMRKAPFAKWLRAEAKPPPYIVLTVGDKCQLRAWNPLDGKCVATLPSPHAAKGVFRSVLCVNKEGRQIITIGDDMNLIVWSLPDFQVSSYVMGHNEEIVHVQLLPQLRWRGAVEDEGGKTMAAAPTERWRVTANRFVCIANDEHPRVVSVNGFGASLLRGHSDIVISCDVSVDGRWIATGGKDQTIRVWNAESSRCVCILSGHTGSVSALSFPKKRPKGPRGAAAAEAQALWLVSGSEDKTMKIWELPSPQKLAEAESQAEDPASVAKSKVAVIAHTKEVNDVVVAPNNKIVASAGQDKLVRVWSFPEGKLLGECKGHRRAVWCVAFSPLDQVIASASGDGTARLWNLRDYSAIRAFQGHTGAVLRVCFLANGMQFMTSGADGLIKLWQIRTADCAATFDEHTGKAWCIDIIGDHMVSGAADSKLCIWRDTTSEQARKRHDEQAELKIKDTKIGLLVQEGRIEDALTLALELQRPGQMRQILSKRALDAVSEQLEGREEEHGADVDGAATKDSVDLKGWVRSLEAKHLENFVGILEQWNSNRKMAPLAQMFLGLLLSTVPAEKLMSVEGLNSICEGLLSYLVRHQARTDSLLQKTFVLDLVLQSSGMGLALMDEFNGFEAFSAEKFVTMSEKRTEELTHDAKHDAASVAKAVEAKGRRAEEALKTTMDVLLGGGDEKGEEDGIDDDLDDSSNESGDGAAAGVVSAVVAEDDDDYDDDAEDMSMPQGKVGSAKRRSAEDDGEGIGGRGVVQRKKRPKRGAA